ncbi:hypothetical protein EJ04DRAFT_568779 [Polyplosphaeria fusca]|uniref:Uncharacterized protein n=1 Tax=Polyplosphaeria fusca TaxID=682080 RepID=A0A9P4QKZ5_9PLEO|nr:hypothetical protein EJ04DRAFT_568779 [Polyplosphaeria fusca]
MSVTVAQTVANNGVVLGYWKNWSHGTVEGATLTLTKSNGAFLTAAMAVFVTYVGSRFWRIACFAAHRWQSSSHPQNAIYHQRQALLRNSDSPDGFLIETFWMMWSWRRRTKSIGTLTRLLSLFAIALVLAVAFAVAGVFSSRISGAMGDEILIKSPNCGYLWWDTGFTVADTDDLINYSNRLTVEAAAYADKCYGTNAASPECPVYVKERIETTVIRNASCPFETGICILDDGNLIIDSGPINVHDELGLNVKPADRYTYRRLTSCAPLRTEGYSSQVNQLIGSIKYPFMNYFYGENLQTGDNFTYDYPLVRPSGMSKHAADYTLMALKNYALNYADFNPIRELNQSDTMADLVLLALSANDVVFEEAVKDPWYSATRSSGSDRSVEYLPDHPTAFVGCKVQHQWCDPNKHGDSACTALASFTGSATEAQSLFVNPAQNASFYALTWALNVAPSIETIIDRLGASALTSKYTLNTGTQGPLPENQWQNDIEHMHSTTLAALQRMTVEQATGPSDPSVQRFFIRPNNEEERQARCVQKVRSTNYTSFSVLGLGLTLGLGILIIITSFMLESLAMFIQKRRKADPYHRLEWSVNSTLQLQRLAHEALGFGTWSGGHGIIPLTERDEELAGVDCTDVEHPRLKAFRDSKVTEEKSGDAKLSGAVDHNEFATPPISPC